ncbi:protein FAM221B [Sturnira hondurensis]|uniref:protein FAM221B n=1 Tax=Sturnira hondurensis TaxID=192404 RepID=UPI001879630C|nr:protein FAM221B [Sturnira hondurensis]XP_036891914.1 protein FAM221B [Sturnira hondurensis]
MEADEVAEEPHTTMDAEEHPSSEDPSARDSQEPPISETPLKASISETPLEPLTSESPLEPSTSQNPLETRTSETRLEPSTSETPLEPHTPESHVMNSISHTPLETRTSEILLEPSISETALEPHPPESSVMTSTSHTLLETHTSETPLESSISKVSLEHSVPESLLEIHISKVPEKQLAAHNASPGHDSGSPSDTLKEGRISESPSSDVSQTRRSIQIPESEFLQKHSLSGPSAQVRPDTSGKEREEGENEDGVDATDRATHVAQPGHHLGKKKEKKGVGRYRVSPVVPTKQAEMVKVANTVHRGMFAAQVKNLFQWENDAALSAIQTGLYIGWRCPHYLWDCFRIGDESKCFCGHLLREHQIVSDISVPCNVNQCRCLMFCFIPSHPEEVGQFWLRRRATFDPKAWRAQCRCKHNHEDHAATGSHPCRVKGCYCNCFESNFLCAACDRRWEEHQTFFETEETRRRGGRPHGADYEPFAEIPTLQETTISNSDFEVLQRQGPSGHPSSHPSPPGFPGPLSLRPGPTSNRHT